VVVWVRGVAAVGGDERGVGHVDVDDELALARYFSLCFNFLRFNLLTSAQMLPASVVAFFGCTTRDA
jgi:hypothetical protein